MEMLTQTNDRVLNICYACGFNNINHFNRIFKSIVGVSPTQYRSANREEAQNWFDFCKTVLGWHGEKKQYIIIEKYCEAEGFVNHLLSCQTLSLKIKTQLARITESRKTHPAENFPEDDLEKLRKYLIAEIQKWGKIWKAQKRSTSPI